MLIHNLPKIVTKAKKRVGHGIGSGKGGHTSSRGQKGQKARRKIYPLFEGTKTKKSLIQRLPLQRGKGKLKSLKPNPVVINLDSLNKLPENSKVDVKLLLEKGIVTRLAVKSGVKVLGNGTIDKKLTVLVPVSKSAQEKIQKAGGVTEQA